MNIYMQDLQNERPHDEIQTIETNPRDKGYQFITTAGHGYLVVPLGDKNYAIAKEIAEYGYEGAYAVYLEEDSEASAFLNRI